MKRLARPFFNPSVTWKFVVTYMLLLAISLTASGIYLYRQNSRSAVSQAQTVMEQNLLQTRESIQEKVKMIENISRLLTSDIKLQTFLGNYFTNESYQYDDYKSNITSFVENILRQNSYIHSLRIFMTNPTIPEVYDSFYQTSRIQNQAWLQEILNNTAKKSGWTELHKETFMMDVPRRRNPEDVFSYYQKINSIRYFDTVGLLEIEVKESVLFDVLNTKLPGQLGNVFVVDGQGIVQSRNIEALHDKNMKQMGLKDLPLNKNVNQIMKVDGKRSVVISMPVSDLGLRLVGVFPVSEFNKQVKKSIKSIAAVLLLALIVLGFIVYLITNALLSRLKLLVKAMKQVKENSLTVSVPIKGNDEFTQIALNFNLMTSRIHELVETVYKIQLMEREAELKALEAQVNPHFLYNTLATISWVARKAKSPEIVHLSGELAQFYRLVLSKGKREILVKDEIQMVKAYLNIQKFRFEDMFDVIYQIDERIFEHCVVKNILQPLVENALIHGIEPKRSHGTIIIKAGFEGDLLFFQVSDDGVGMPRDRLKELLGGHIERTSGSGYAVRNIMERLAAYYGDRHQFLVMSELGIGTSVIVKFTKERV